MLSEAQGSLQGHRCLKKLKNRSSKYNEQSTTVDGRNIASDFTLHFYKGTLRYLSGTFQVPVGYLKTIAEAVVLG